MKKLGLIFCLFMLFVGQAAALNVVERKIYLDTPLKTIGVPDFPPFSYYEKSEETSSDYYLHGAFLRPLQEAAQKYNFVINPLHFNGSKSIDLKNFVINVRGGMINLMFGIYSNTTEYKGLEMLYPAVVSNPIHVITLPDTQEKIKSVSDLKNLRGIAYRNEPFSDFVKRKLDELNIYYVDSIYDLYEKLYTDEADYILGSMYYHKIQASRLGIEQYLAYSVKPLFKIPVFLTLSQQTPKYSEYVKVFRKIFSDPKFSTAIKEEILNIINEEIEKNMGIVPPSFAKNTPESEKSTGEEIDSEAEIVKNKGGRVKDIIKEKSIDEVLDGI